MAPPVIDLWLARGSSLFGVLGPILLGLASEPSVLVLCTFTLRLRYDLSPFTNGQQHSSFSLSLWDTLSPSSHTEHH